MKFNKNKIKRCILLILLSALIGIYIGAIHSMYQVDIEHLDRIIKYFIIIVIDSFLIGITTAIIIWIKE